MTAGAPVEVPVTITHLVMQARPAYPRPHQPGGAPAHLVAAEAPPAWYFLSLYRAVGRAYHWTDRLDEPGASLQAWLDAPEVTLWTLMRRGWPHGFFVLDGRRSGRVDLAYFGLVPEAIGTGLGRFLLETAVHAAWDRPGTDRVTVNTCSLDHPRALPLYQRAGFVPERRETVMRTIAADARPS